MAITLAGTKKKTAMLLKRRRRGRRHLVMPRETKVTSQMRCKRDLSWRSRLDARWHDHLEYWFEKIREKTTLYICFHVQGAES
jgi:hypothetical protein